MRTRRAALVLLFLLGSIVHPPFAAADERDRFHAWLLAGPTFLLDGSPRFGSPAVPLPTLYSTALGLPAGDNPKGAIPHFHAGFAMAATPRVSLSFDVRSFEVEQRLPATSSSEPPRLNVLAWGPGVRRTVGSGSLRPFLQANVLVLTEDLDGAANDGSHQSVGLGLLAGADVHLTDALSIPIAATILLGKPRNDVSSVGLVAGLAVHPATGWSADPAVRAIEMRDGDGRTAVETPPRSRLELGLGWSETQDFGDHTYDSGNSLVGHAVYMRSMKPGLGLTFASRLYRRRSNTGTTGIDQHPSRETRSVVLAGPGIRFKRTAGWARRFFEANLWLASDTRTSQGDFFKYSTRRTGPGLGFALGLDVQLARGLTLPLALRYDHLIQQDDYGLTTLEGGLAVAFGTASGGDE